MKQRTFRRRLVALSAPASSGSKVTQAIGSEAHRVRGPKPYLPHVVQSRTLGQRPSVVATRSCCGGWWGTAVRKPGLLWTVAEMWDLAGETRDLVYSRTEPCLGLTTRAGDARLLKHRCYRPADLFLWLEPFRTPVAS